MKTKGSQTCKSEILPALAEAEDDDDDADDDVGRGSGDCVGGDKKIRVKNMKMR